MKLTVISTYDAGDYYEGCRLTVSEDTVESATEDPDDYRPALRKWMESRSIEDMWVFAGEPIPFDHEAEKRRMVEEAKERKRIADAEALAKNAEEARNAKPPGFRDRELEAEKARVRRLEAKLKEAEETQTRRNDIARNWERTASTYTPRALRAEALLREHGIPVPGEPQVPKDVVVAVVAPWKMPNGEAASYDPSKCLHSMQDSYYRDTPTGRVWGCSDCDANNGSDGVFVLSRDGGT